MELTDRKYLVLVVDDDPNNVELLQLRLQRADYDVITAEDGEIAWALLLSDQYQFDAVLLDRMMPNMDGMELLSLMKQDQKFQDIPVIMQTAASSDEHVIEGMRAGAFHYLTKPYKKNLVLSITKAAIEDFQRYKKLKEEAARTSLAINLVDDAQFSFNTIDEAQSLAAFLSSACPKPAAVVIGLSELLVNAVEHGNLEFSYKEKSVLIQENRWHEEVKLRLAAEENRRKRVIVVFKKTPGAIVFRIKDEGKGFDWRPYMTINVARAFDTHGRGIALATMLSFNHIEFLGIGNEVLATIELYP